MRLPEGFLLVWDLILVLHSQQGVEALHEDNAPHLPQTSVQEPQGSSQKYLGLDMTHGVIQAPVTQLSIDCYGHSPAVKSNVKVIWMKLNRHLPKDHLLALTLPYGFPNFRKWSDNMQSLPCKAWLIYPHKHIRGRRVKTVISYSVSAFPLGTDSLFLWFSSHAPGLCVFLLSSRLPGQQLPCWNSIFWITQFLIFPNRGSHSLPGKSHPL